jgi:hypothetical protein
MTVLLASGIRKCKALSVCTIRGGLGVGSHSVLHACTVSFYNPREHISSTVCRNMHVQMQQN